MWKEVEQDSKRATEIRATNRSPEDQHNESEPTNKIPLENKSDQPKPQGVEENNQPEEKKAVNHQDDSIPPIVMNQGQDKQENVLQKENKHDEQHDNISYEETQD